MAQAPAQNPNLIEECLLGLKDELVLTRTIPSLVIFSGKSENLRDWMRHIDILSVDHREELLLLMITKSVKGIAADYLTFLKQENLRDPQNHPINWQYVREAMYGRFNSLIDRDFSKQQLMKLTQSKHHSLTEFASKIDKVAKDAYNQNEMINPLVVALLRDIFVYGLRDHKLGQELLSRNPRTLEEALATASQIDKVTKQYNLCARNIKPLQHEDMDVDITDDKNQTSDTHTPTTQDSKLDNITTQLNSLTKQFNEQNKKPHTNTSQKNKNNKPQPQNRNFQYKRNTYQRPQQMVQQPQLMVQQPQPMVQQPQLMVQQPQPMVQQPQPMVQQPQPMVQQPQPMVQQPMVQQPQPMVQQPMVQQPNQLVQQPQLIQQPYIQPQITPNNRPLQWTTDGKPICAYCNKAGHYRKNCLKRQHRRQQRTQQNTQQNTQRVNQPQQITQPQQTLN